MGETPFIAVIGPNPAHFSLSSDVVTVGRTPSNLIQLDDPEVSRAHARFERRGTSVLLTDLNSSNGTYVNGSRIVGTVTLSDRDVVAFAGVQTQFHAARAQHPAQTPSVPREDSRQAQSDSSGPSASLLHHVPERIEPQIPSTTPSAPTRVPAPSIAPLSPDTRPGDNLQGHTRPSGPRPTTSGGPPPEAALERSDGPPLVLSKQETSLGRLADNDIILANDTFASHHHARIVAHGGGKFVLIDNGSANGTFVNGSRADEPFQLEPGDEILIGTSSFYFRRLAPVNKKRRGQPRVSPPK